MSTELSKRLKQLRKSKTVGNKPLTQAELAREMHLTKQSISAYENGTATPSLETILNFARYFDVSTDYLLGNVDADNEGITDVKVAQFIGCSCELIHKLQGLSKMEHANVAYPKIAVIASWLNNPDFDVVIDRCCALYNYSSDAEGPINSDSMARNAYYTAVTYMLKTLSAMLKPGVLEENADANRRPVVLVQNKKRKLFE